VKGILEVEMVKTFIVMPSLTGRFLIRRKDGALFSLTPEKETDSPLNVKGVRTKASTEDILSGVRESRKKL
jgi:hypothetical protein